MASPRLDSIRRWCAGHPAIVASNAVYLVVIARLAADLVRIGQEHDYGRKLPLYRDLDRWLSYYRDEKRLLADMKSIGKQIPELATLISELEGMVDSVRALPDAVDLRAPEVEACGKRQLALFFKLHEPGGDEPSGGAIEVQDPRFLALWFYITTWLPAVLLYRVPPQRLLRLACRGELAALRCLHAIDPFVLSEPAIARVLFANSSAKSLMQRPSRLPRIRPLRWKISAAAAVRVMGSAISYRLTYEAIADLFHAFASAFDGRATDADLNDLQPRTFERAVSGAVKQGQVLLMTPSAKRALRSAVNERLPRERNRSSSDRA